MGLFGATLNAMTIANVPPNLIPQSLGQLLSTQAITLFQSGLLPINFRSITCSYSEGTGACVQISFSFMGGVVLGDSAYMYFREFSISWMTFCI